MKKDLLFKKIEFIEGELIAEYSQQVNNMEEVKELAEMVKKSKNHYLTYWKEYQEYRHEDLYIPKRIWVYVQYKVSVENEMIITDLLTNK